MAKKFNGEFDLDIDNYEFFPLENSGDDLFNDRPKLGVGGYIKNVLKSVRNLGVTLGDSLFPEVAANAKEVGGVFVESKDILIEQKDKLMDQIQKFRGNESKPLKESAGNFVKEIGDDLLNRFKTGKFFKSDYFIDMDDFDFNMGFDDDTSGSSVTEADAGKGKVEKDPNAPKEVRIRRKKAKQYAFEVENQRTKYIGDAVIGASQASIAASIDIYNKTQLMQEAHAHVTHAYLKNIATNIYKLTNINLQSMQAQVEYGKKDLAFTQELTSMIKDLHQINVDIYKKQQNAYKKNKANTYKEVFGMGFSGSNYAQGIFQNIKDMLGNNFALSMMMGMMPMMNMGEGMGFKQSPAKMAMSMFNPITMLARLSLDSRSKIAIERVGKMFNALPVLFNRKMTGWAQEGGIKGIIGEMLGMRQQESVASVEKFSDMNLDSPTAFDVRTKRTINEVIPAYLAQIAAGVTGREETRYDFKSQTFKTVSSLRKMQQDSLQYAMKSDWQFNEITNDIRDKAMQSLLDTGTTKQYYDKKTKTTKYTKASQKVVDEYTKGFEDIERSIINLPYNFDSAKAMKELDESEAKGKLTSYVTRLTQHMKSGNEQVKMQILRAFLNSYDELDPNQKQFFNSSGSNVAMAYNQAQETSLEYGVKQISAGGSAYAMGSKADRLRKLKNVLAYEEAKAKSKEITDAALAKRGETRELWAASRQRKIADIKEQIRALNAEGETSAVGAGTVSIENEDAYSMGQRFLTVPNMLKTIIELLAGGIMVYPQKTMPKHTKKMMGGISKHLSNESAAAIGELIRQQEEDEEMRMEALEASIRANEAAVKYRRMDRFDNIDDNSMLGRVKSWYNKNVIQRSSNVLQHFASVFGFSDDWDHTQSDDDNKTRINADGYIPKQNLLRRTADEWKKSDNPVKQKAAIALDLVSGKADFFKVTAESKAKAKKQFEERVEQIRQTLLTSGEKVAEFKKLKEKGLEIVEGVKDPAQRNAAVNKMMNDFVKTKVEEGLINKLPDEQKQLINSVINGSSEITDGKGSIIDQAKSFVGDLFGLGKSKASEIKDKSLKIVEEVREDPKKFAEKHLKELKQNGDIIIKTKKGITEVYTNINGQAAEKIATFKKSDTYESLVNKFNKIKEKMEEKGSSALSIMKEKGSEFLELGKSKASEIKGGISGIFSSLTSGVQSTVNGFRLGPIYDKMDTIISLLTTIAGKDMNPEDLKKLQQSVTKEANPKKRSLISRILTSPFWAAKKAILGGAGILGTGFGAAGSFLGKALPGIGKGIGGFVQGGLNLLGGAAGGLFGIGKKAFGKVLGVPGAIVGGVGDLFRMKKSSVDKKLMKLSINGGVSVESILSSFDRNEMIKMVAAVLDKKEDDEKLNKMSDERLAKELIKYWKKSARKGGGAGDAIKGIGSAAGGIASGLGSIFSNMISVGGHAATTAAGAVGNFAMGTIGKAGNFLLGRGKKHALANFEKGVLTNLISIRTILENQYGPADSSQVESEMGNYQKGPAGILRRAAGGIGKVISAPFKGIFNAGKKLFGGIKSGFKGRKEGSGIREGSYEDVKLDKQEALEEERKTSDSQALAVIAANTTLIAKKITGLKPSGDKNEIKQGGGGLMGTLSAIGGAALIGAGAFAIGGGLKAIGSKYQDYQEDLEQGMDIDPEAESNLDKVEFGANLAGAFRLIKWGLNLIMKNKHIAKVLGPVGSRLIDLLMKLLMKAAPKIAPRIIAWAASVGSVVGVAIPVASAVVSFGLGFARAKHYFRHYIKPGQTITFRMRLVSGLVKALDGFLGGIFDVATTLLYHKPLIVFLYDTILSKFNNLLPLTKDEKKQEEETKRKEQEYANGVENNQEDFIEPERNGGSIDTTPTFAPVLSSYNVDTSQVGVDVEKPANFSTGNDIVTHAVSTAAAGVGLEKGKGFLQSKPLVQNLYPNESPSPYLVPDQQRSAGGARADINGLSPEMRNRVIAFAQHYYDITGKPLRVTSAKRSMEQQIRMWEAEAKTKYTGNRTEDAKRAAVAGGKFFGFRNGSVAYPNPYSSHMMGNAVDFNISSTPFDSEVNTSKRHWLFDDIAEKYGLRRTLITPNNPNAPTLERWHFGLMAGSKNKKESIKEEPPVISVQEQKKDGMAVATVDNGQLEFMDPVKSPDISIPETPSYMNQASTTTSTNISGSTAEIGASSTGTISSTSAGASGMASTASNVNDAAGLMAKVEENTRKTYEVLAKHLPNLDAMTKILTAILAATASNAGSGSGTGGNDTIGQLSSILAVGK